MSLTEILTVILGLAVFVALKQLFVRDRSRGQVDIDLVKAYQELKSSGPVIAEKKEKYEKALRNLKSVSTESEPKS